jgi:CheY-like chemotaxis protein
MSESKTILVIDDEPKTTTYFNTLLTDHGFSAHTANSAYEGLRQP